MPLPLAPELLRQRQARALLLLSTLFWGLSFPLGRGLQLTQKSSSPGLPDITLASLDNLARFGLAALFLLLFQGYQLRRVTRLELSQGLGLSFFASAGIYLQTLGLNWSDASVAAFLTQTYSLLVPLFVAVRDRRWPSIPVWSACGMVLLGVALLSPRLLTHAEIGAGEIAVLVGSMFFAGQIMWVERPRYEFNHPVRVTLIMFLTLTFVFLFSSLFLGGLNQPLQPLFFAQPVILELLLGLVLFCTILNFFIMNAWQPYVSATEAGMIYCLEPVVASVLATFMPGWIARAAGIHYANEELTYGFYFGAFLILSSTVLIALNARAQKQP